MKEIVDTKKNLQEIYYKGIENQEYLDRLFMTKKHSNFALVIYVLLGVVFSKRVREASNRIAWVNGSRGYEKLYADSNFVVVHHGTFFKNPIKFFLHLSIFSVIPRIERVRLFIKAMVNYGEIKTGNIGYWLEYYFIFEFIQRTVPKVIASPHTFDRQISWITCLSHKLGVEIEINQHGITPSNLAIPNKVYCNRFYAISDEEIIVSKNNIVANWEKCEFLVEPFTSVISFAEFSRSDEMIVIGIATQCNRLYTEKILNYLKDEKYYDCKNSKIILMLHPLDDPKNYKQMANHRVHVAVKEKYLNVDVLITENSTIVYDYILENYNGLILQIDKEATCNFMGVKNLVNFSDMEEAIKYLGKYCENLNNTKS